jgi:hypothetical protein
MLRPVILMHRHEALARIEANRGLIEERLRGMGARLVRVSIEPGGDYYDPDSGYYSIVLVVSIKGRVKALRLEELGLGELLM